MSSSKDSPDTPLTLYTYFRSSCSGRLRIALNLKRIPYAAEYLDLKAGHHHDLSYCDINPSESVPTLRLGPTGGTITQSLAALEYLEERFPMAPSLLPTSSNHLGRATVRSLVNIISSDFQPVTNMRVLARVSQMGVEGGDWFRHFGDLALKAYEAIVKNTAGEYSYGNEVTLADVCLVPAVWNAQRYGIDMYPFPTIRMIVSRMQRLEAVQKAHWKAQPDCPPDLRR